MNNKYKICLTLLCIIPVTIAMEDKKTLTKEMLYNQLSSELKEIKRTRSSLTLSEIIDHTKRSNAIVSIKSTEKKDEKIDRYTSEYLNKLSHFKSTFVSLYIDKQTKIFHCIQTVDVSGIFHKFFNDNPKYSPGDLHLALLLNNLEKIKKVRTPPLEAVA